MYSVEFLRNTITRLYHGGAAKNYGGYTSDALLGSLDFDILIQAVRHKAEMVSAYTVQGAYPKSFSYVGVDLFGQRAAKLFETIQKSDAGEVLTVHSYELWLLEDMSLAVVSCVEIDFDGACETSYRVVKGCDPWECGMDLDLRELTAALYALCEPACRREQPVYEL